MNSSAQRLERVTQSLLDQIGFDSSGLIAGVPAEARRELQAALEELRVAEEEMRQQNEQLALSHEALDREHRLFRDLFDNAPVGYLVTDRYGRIDDSNRAITELTGREADALRTKAIFVVVPLAARRALRHALLRLTSSGEPQRIESFVWGPDGSEIPVELSLNHSPTGRGHVRWSVRDLTLQKRAEAAERLEHERDIELHELTTSLISHELRTPLTMILGNADLLARADTLSSEEASQTVATIQGQSRQLQRIINNILTLKRHAEPSELEPILLQRAIPQMVEQAEPILHGHKVHVYVDPDLLPVLGHAGFIEQILENYLSNGDKYSAPEDPIEVRVERDGGMACVSVHDRGIGLSDDDQRHLFEPFFRSTEIKERVGGVGLGLVVCKMLAESQGGEVWAAPREGGGATFGLRLPLLQHAELA